ncbi:MAG: radical SAM protein [Tannerella sp.]|jgi:MoaA/NifB/PqqE/SkfB family radical SAM enzyme|nr:radical SAM protein [Tannerella sp.]
MGLKNFIKRLIPYRLILFRRTLIPTFKKIMRTNMRYKKMIPILHLHLTDHCNLNCRGCDNFSPLSPEVFADTEVFERDCARMAELCGGRVSEVQLLGGEPLLHPHVTAFTDIVRKYFAVDPVKLVTNGILLFKQTDAFWENCRRNRIEIVVTKYPISIDHAGIEQHVKDKGVLFSFYGSTGSVAKTMQCSPLDPDGKQNPRDSFLRCSSANRCISLDNGKLYTCSLIPYVKYFNSHFRKNLEVTENDYMDIYKANGMDEIRKFISKPMPFCRYCNKKGMIWDIGYGVSKKEISEWTG